MSVHSSCFNILTWTDVSLFFRYFWIFIFLYFDETFSKMFFKKYNQKKMEKVDKKWLQAIAAYETMDAADKANVSDCCQNHYHIWKTNRLYTLLPTEPTPAWLWAVVAVAISLLLVLALIAFLVVRRVRQQRAEQDGGSGGSDRIRHRFVSSDADPKSNKALAQQAARQEQRARSIREKDKISLRKKKKAKEAEKKRRREPLGEDSIRMRWEDEREEEVWPAGRRNSALGRLEGVLPAWLSIEYSIFLNAFRMGKPYVESPYVVPSTTIKFSFRAKLYRLKTQSVGVNTIYLRVGRDYAVVAGQWKTGI